MKRLAYLPLMLLPLLCRGQAQDAPISASPVAGTGSGSASVLAPPPPNIPESVLGQVHDRLKLATTQEPLWSDYVARIENYSKVYYQERPVSALTGESAPRQIARFIDNMQNRLAGLDEIERSTKALYEVLDASQKQVADQSLFSTIPIFASALNATNSSPNDARPRKEKPEGSQHRRRGGGMSGMGQ